MRKIIVTVGLGCVLIGWLAGQSDLASQVARGKSAGLQPELFTPIPTDKAEAILLPTGGSSAQGNAASNPPTLAPVSYAPDLPLNGGTDLSPPAAPEYLYVTGARVNLRKDASAKSQKLGQLTGGTQVEVIGTADGWTKIATGGTPAIIGWIANDFLATTPPVTLVSAPAPEPRTRSVAPPTTAELAAARRDIIAQSIATYPGSCPCPYNTDRAGHRCGKRSAWSKPGGYAPICYESDVSEARLQSYLARQRGATD